jgi:hypothetical protein
MSNQDRPNLPRRRFIELAAGTAAVASGLLPALAHAADLPHLSATDPAAQALGYNPETRNVPSSKFANHRPTQACGNCNFYKGAAGAEWGACQILPGKAVHVRGWCSAYVAKA